jgi:hypothetical protein
MVAELELSVFSIRFVMSGDGCIETAENTAAIQMVVDWVGGT